ncbi:MAG TPA: rRNA maturation RNase YbeY [Chloroflexota bacterium]|nr:rRNA maturation RNase YbeY [Chloroflexota bacterium]
MDEALMTPSGEQHRRRAAPDPAAVPPSEPSEPQLDFSLTVLRQGAGELPFDDQWFEQVAACAVAAAARLPAGVPSSRFEVPGSRSTRNSELGTRNSELEASLLLTDDLTLRDLNHRYRGLDRPTDVLSFPQLEGAPAALPPAGQPLHLGDIAISAPRAREQATAGGRTLARELGYLLVHGVLHLLGFDHQTDEDQAAMRRVEERALTAAGLAQEGR